MDQGACLQQRSMEARRIPLDHTGKAAAPESSNISHHSAFEPWLQQLIMKSSNCKWEKKIGLQSKTCKMIISIIFISAVLKNLHQEDNMETIK